MQTLPTKLYSAQQAREIDRIAQEQTQVTGLQLMTKAAEASFQVIKKYYPEAKKIVVFCGAGNNAGDGYLIAKLALQAGYKLQLLSVVAEEKLTGDAALAKQAYSHAGGVILHDLHLLQTHADLVVDALLGTGLDRPVLGKFAAAIQYINALNIPVLAVDIPSGLNADTGNIMACAVRAELTITFIVLKKGLFTGLAADYCGTVLFANLDVSNSVIERQANQESLLQAVRLAKRARCAHKGMLGHVLVVGGDYGYAGAVKLAAEAALNSGAGLVSVATRQEHASQMYLTCPELMGHALERLIDIEALLDKVSVLVLGPGLAQRSWAKNIWPALIGLNLPRVIDADALNLLVTSPVYSEQWILTPHPGEAARLLGCSTAAILQDRFKAVRALQAKYGGVCVLKGAGTLISDGKHVYVNTTGNPGMAAGGMGDVLSGIIGALLAQHYSLLDAAKIGVYLHGLAADKAAVHFGERGLRATDVLQFLREVVN
ncbi:MAG: NAD(P)H-hydrate dehydratase [Methyloprofundus sp.]|nr:NAD(P)H-hydrate dehydratase [Methyloprofundus sp.]